MTPSPGISIDYADLSSMNGKYLGTSAWREISQSTIDAFATLTGDTQWIHTDPVRAAAEGPFGGTVAHGFLTLSLATSIVSEVVTLTGVSAVVNYACNAVRFTAPVPAGSQIRGVVDVNSVRRRGRNFTEFVLGISFEIEDGPVACTAELVILVAPEATK